MASIPQSLSDNPITRAELTHQQSLAPSHKWQRWSVIFGLGLGVAAISSLILALFVPQLAGLVRVSPRELESLLRGWFGTLTVLLGGLIMIHHLSFAAAGLQLAAASIAREKQGRTWESLVLTGVDARRIVYGKWWATMQTLWQMYRPLLALRFVAALWVGMIGARAQLAVPLAAPPLLNIVLIALMAAVFPLCYVAFTGTLGLLASLVVTSETTANRVASLAYFGTIAASLSMVMITFALPFGDIEPMIASLIPALFVTPVDGGMLAIIGIHTGGGAASSYYLLGLFLCIALYGALTWAGLRGAQALSVRQRALPPIS